MKELNLVAAIIASKHLIRIFTLLLLASLIGCGVVTVSEPDSGPDASEPDAGEVVPDAWHDAQSDPECEAGWAIAHINQWSVTGPASNVEIRDFFVLINTGDIAIQHGGIQLSVTFGGDPIMSIFQGEDAGLVQPHMARGTLDPAYVDTMMLTEPIMMKGNLLELAATTGEPAMGVINLGVRFTGLPGVAYTSVSVQTDTGGVLSIQPTSARRVCATL